MHKITIDPPKLTKQRDKWMDMIHEAFFEVVNKQKINAYEFIFIKLGDEDFIIKSTDINSNYLLITKLSYERLEDFQNALVGFIDRILSLHVNVIHESRALAGQQSLIKKTVSPRRTKTNPA